MLPPTLFPLLIPILLILVAAVSPARAAPFSQLGLVSSFQSNIAASLSAWLAPSQPANSDKRFTLKHAVHQGTTRYRGLSARADFPPSVSTSSLNAHTIRTVRQRITRAKDPKAYLLARGTSLEQAQCASEQAVEWQDVDVEAPDTSHRETLLALAKMTSQAYDNDTSGWEPGYGGWNLVSVPHMIPQAV